jgi:hypothetical protein
MEHPVSFASVKKQKVASSLLFACLIMSCIYNYVPLPFQKFVCVWCIVVVLVFFVYKTLPFFEKIIAPALAIFFGAIILFMVIISAILYTIAPSNVEYYISMLR